MNKRYNIQFRASLLLLIYLISILATLQFHHHHHKIVAFNEATACEKEIFYGNAAVKCKHNTHLSESIKKCSLCDQHTVSPHISDLLTYGYFKLAFNSSYVTFNSDYKFSQTSFTSNRGPPTV